MTPLNADCLLPTLETRPHPETFASLEMLVFPRPWSSADFICDEHHAHFSLWHERRCVAYALVRHIFDEGELLRIGTHPRHRGLGYGTSLLHALLEHSRRIGTTRMFLEVASDNGPAIHLYRKHGFSLLGVRKGYYRGKGDALTMARDLTH